MKIIELSNISFSYSEKSEESDFKLSNLSLDIRTGEFISILGPNGCGKSTLLKIIANIFEVGDGTLKINNINYKNINRKAFAKQVAFVPQNLDTNFPFSVFEIVMMGRSPYLNFFGVETKTDHDLVNEVLDKLEIAPLKEKGINEVSGGEAQRALIARALVQQPKVLLLDEPNAHLDIKHQISIFNLLKNYNKENDLTVITVLHDLNFANNYSSRTVLLKDGKIMHDSIPAETLTVNNIQQIFGINSMIIPEPGSGNSIISFSL